MRAITQGQTMTSWNRKMRRANQRSTNHVLNQHLTDEGLFVYPKNNPAVEKVRYNLDGSRDIFFTKKYAAKMQAELEESARAFEEKFGRPMRGDDPLFWDPDASEPRPIDESTLIKGMVELMTEVGIHPAVIYAYSKTGILLTEANQELMSSDAIAEYEAAYQEYFDIN